jgi:hypothetical protein
MNSSMGSVTALSPSEENIFQCPGELVSSLHDQLFLYCPTR